MTVMELTPEQKSAEKEIDNTIRIARYTMSEKTPLFGILSQNLRIVPAPLHMRNIIRTAAVTPTGICMYNPNFMGALPFEQICGVLAHEALHPGLDFFGRFSGCDLSRANRAHDFAINLVIKDNKNQGLDLPSDCLLDEKYRNVSAEEIYLQLAEEERQQKSNKGQSQDQNGQPQSGQDQSQSGDSQSQGGEDQQQGGSGNGQSQNGDSQQQDGSGNGQSQNGDSQQQDGSGNGQSQNGDSQQQDGSGNGQSQNGDSQQQNGNGNSQSQGGELPDQGNDYTLQDDINQEIIDAIEEEFYGKDGKRPTQQELKEMRENAKQRWRDALEQAVIAEQNNGKGNIPEWMQTEISGILNPKLNIGKMLKRYFGKFGQKSLASYKKRNRRNLFLPDTFPRPGYKSNKPELYVLIDTSGSMWDAEGFNMVKGTLGLIKNLANNGGYNIRIIMCDTNVKCDMDFEEVQEAVRKKSLKSLGGGGSNFIPAFEYIWQDCVLNNSSQAPILCITDGYIDVPDKQPKVRTETMWITPERVSPPTRDWGTHAEMIF